MPILILGLVLAVVLGFVLWVVRGDSNDDRDAGFNPVFGTGGGDSMDPERGIIGPDEADIERFGGGGS
jgi:hypothetical protein